MFGIDLESLTATIAGKMWSLPLFFLLLGCGLIFSVCSKFVQWRILTHGYACIRGKYDDPNDTGHVNHFQALCAALSGTIGLGNIAGVALAVSVGGPGAIFWMWIVGVFGMALKFMECSLAVMYRDKRHRDGSPAPDDEPFDPHRHEVRGGPMWYIQKALVDPLRKRSNPLWMLFKLLAILFALCTACSALGQGNMFQGWNVADVLSRNFSVPTWLSATLMAILVSLVIIGGIRRIGEVAGRLVPVMCVLYILGALYVIIVHAADVPYYLALIVKSAFQPAAELGGFAGASVWIAFQHGLRRALFSNEAGQGSAAMAHAAARTEEPIREGVVAGIGPFIDTLIICTMSALVLMMSGAWDRPAVGTVHTIKNNQLTLTLNADVPERFAVLYDERIAVNEGTAAPALRVHTQRGAGRDFQSVAGPIVKVQRTAGQTGWAAMQQITLDISAADPAQRERLAIGQPVHLDIEGAELTRFAFDSTIRGFGLYVVTLAVCLFAFSTMITWSYYGERGAEYLLGPRAILPYKVVFIVFIVIGMLLSKFQVVYDFSDALTATMAFCNLPAVLLLSPTILRAGGNYFRRLDSGQMRPHTSPEER